jgi:hypothetical protein
MTNPTSGRRRRIRMWSATWLLVFGVTLVADSVREPGGFWWCMLGFLFLVFVPALIIDAVGRDAG